ncbi:Cupin domain-containing protein [Pararobbsia alpina]
MTMERHIRIYDVGLNTEAASTVVGAGNVPMIEGADIELWQSFVARAGAGQRGIPFYPPDGESLPRFFVLPAPPAAGDSDVDWDAIAEGFFKGNEIDECRVDGARHPLMHKTPTSDCVILLEGRVGLVLDHGEPLEIRPFDVVRQSGTHHAWINLGPGPALLISLMHGT